MALTNRLAVRMYDVGFGDCFLLALPGKRTILVDAGFHCQGKGAFSANELVQQILDDVQAISGEPRLDVVVATHRHQDHIFAFNSPKWNEVAVGEVWMPWVEDKSNAMAMGLWKKQKRFATNLADALATFELGEDARFEAQFILWNAGIQRPEYKGAADVAGWSNAGALQSLHEGFARRDRAKPRFLPERKTLPELFETSALPDVRIHVLGPPHDAYLIDELDPEADGETYRALALRAAAQSAPDRQSTSLVAPFGDAWQVPVDEVGDRLESSEVERINDLAHGADAIAAVRTLDTMINSTSLVLLIQVGKARLLLAGDAEWGSWRRILADEESRLLIRGATFFKVGHHGSHNATSKTLLEDVLPRRIPAMISTQEGPGQYRSNIPLQSLLAKLTEREIHYARSDRASQPLPKGFKRGTAAKWIDIELPC